MTPNYMIFFFYIFASLGSFSVTVVVWSGLLDFGCGPLL